MDATCVIMIFLIIVCAFQNTSGDITGMSAQDDTALCNMVHMLKMLKGQMAEQKNATEALINKVSELEGKMNGVIEALSARISELEAKEHVIGFSAQTASVSAPVSADWQTVKYITVISNFGNSYNSSTGIFRCPLHGVYFFSFSLRGDNLKGTTSTAASYVDGLLKVNNVTKSELFCNHEDSTKATESEMLCSNTVLVECPAYGEVRVEGRGSVSTGDSESSFTGIHLHQL